MPTSQNGWPVLESGSPSLHTWTVPAANGSVRLTLRNGSAGFLLCHFLLWVAENVEPLAGGQTDDWGYAYRPIRGQSTGFSNHASGTAADMNATKHPLGKVGTFTPKQTAAIRSRLSLYRGALRWGGDYNGRKDEMHVELNMPLPFVESLARDLLDTPAGVKVCDANPGQQAVVES